MLGYSMMRNFSRECIKRYITWNSLTDEAPYWRGMMGLQGRRVSTHVMTIRSVESLLRSLKKNSCFFIGGVSRKMEVLLKIKLGEDKDKVIEQIKQQLEEIDNPIHVSSLDLASDGGCYELYIGDRFHIHIAIKGDELIILKEDMS
jgi:hypothetical protein